MNHHELAARENKARIITGWLRLHRPDVDPYIAGKMSQFGRDAVATLAGRQTDPPKDWTSVSPATWEQVVSRLKRPVYVAPVINDVFDGLPQ